LNLKQCFLYCSLFPRSFCDHWRDLIKQWVAEGFLVKRDGSTFEEIGEEYYKELVERYLINPEPEFDDSERCNIHDCVVNMARLLSAEEILADEITKLVEIPPRPCHVSLVSNQLKEVLEEVKTKEKLRTLILSKNTLKDDALRDVFTRLKMLRVLDISETSIQVIPNTLQNLLHLRYLNLSRTKIKELPESIGYVPFLQYLLLQECKRLRSLPKGIEKLKRLRNLDITGTKIDQFFFRIGELVDLNSLDFFNVNNKLEQQEDNKGWPLGELKSLIKLRSLCILQIDKTGDLDEAKEALLGTKPCLKELELSCSSKATPLENPIKNQKVQGIIDELCPPSCLEDLKIINYSGNKYPSWLFIDFLPNLQKLELINCQFCQTLPPLGQLPKLLFLYIANASYLRDIGPDIMGTSREVVFPKLEKLHIQDSPKLESWTGLERPGPMPCLKAFQLQSCPEIRFLPSCMNHSKSLKELRIVDCKSLELIKNLTRIKELSVWNTPNLRKISNLTSLEELSISHSLNLQIVKNANSLKSIQIFDYDLEAIPRWLKAYSLHVQSLELAGTVQMLQRCLISGPDWDIIQDIAHVYGHSNTRTYLLYSRSPFSFETNLSVPVPQEVENSPITETVLIERILEETQESFSKENLVNEEIMRSINTRSKEPSTSRSLHDDPPTISINPISPPTTTTIRDNILVNMSENISAHSNSDTDNTDTSIGNLMRRRCRKNNITEVVSIDADNNANSGDSMPSDLVHFNFGMPNNASATGETFISKVETALIHKEDNLIIDENITRSINMSLRSLQYNPPTISINPISPPTTTIRDKILVDMSENKSEFPNSNTDSIGTSTGSLARRRRRKNNITEVVSIDAEKNANSEDSMHSDLVFHIDFGMPNASVTEEMLISKLENVLSHKSSEKNLSQNASDSSCSDFASVGNTNLLSSKTETLGHQTIKKHTTEKSRDPLGSNLLCGDPNASTNKEKLVQRTITLNSKKETMNHHNSEKRAGKNTSLNLKFSSDLEAEPIQIRRLGNSNSAYGPVIPEDIFEEANHIFATVEGTMNVAIDQVEGIHQLHKIEEDDLGKQQIQNASSSEVVVAGSSTSEIASTRKCEVNDKLWIKEKLKDYLIAILLAVSVMQMFLIFWLILWFIEYGYSK
jgi:Leucine-rich repeat (LRR) protein